MVEWHALHVKLENEDCVVVCSGELNEKQRVRKFHRGAEKEFCVVDLYTRGALKENAVQTGWCGGGRGKTWNT